MRVAHLLEFGRHSTELKRTCADWLRSKEKSQYATNGGHLDQKIEVGFAYRCKRYPEDRYHIIHKDPNREGTWSLPFVGYADSGHIRFFNEKGEDEWVECGGNWFALDLSTKEPAHYGIAKTAVAAEREKKNEMLKIRV
jgi:hypothetical protein